MQKDIKDYSRQYRDDVIQFAQELVRTKSYSGAEEDIAHKVVSKMKLLGYDEVSIDAMGNILGRVGNGNTIIMFDSHMDTVEVTDEGTWKIPAFSGEIVDGRLHGRGSVDMKSGMAASIYAGAIAKELGFLEGKTILVSCTVYEEDCDGENLKHLFKEYNLKPDFFVTCEPSDNRIVTGHKGKAQIAITSQGISAHGSAPEKGKNAIYEMAEIIQRVEKANSDLMKTEGERGTLVLSRITSVSVSLNAVPSECEIYLDRRMVVGETEDTIKEEMDAIIAGKDASWEIGTIKRTSWKGVPIIYRPLHLAWRISPVHPLYRACNRAYQQVFDTKPEYDYWDFSTNAVAPVSMGIPVIGFGPGEYKLAHMIDENCKVEQIVEACEFYANLIKTL